MRSLTCRTLVAVLLAGALSAGSALLPAAAQPAHAEPVAGGPRLLLDADDLAELRERTRTGSGARAWITLMERVDTYLTSPEGQPLYHLDPDRIGDGSSYQDQNQLPTMLIDLAFAYLITENEVYGRLAIDCLLALAEHRWPFWQQSTQYLGVGDLLKGVALTFDWTRNLMTSHERLTIVQALGAAPSSIGNRRVLDVVTASGPAADPGNNWAGVTAGGAGLALMAILDEPGAPADAEALLAAAVARTGRYLTVGFGPEGAGGEGWVYGGYGLHNALPFALALRDSGRDDLIAANPGLRRLVNWGSHELIPSNTFDGSMPLNDSIRDALPDEMIEYMWALDPGSRTVSWFWSRTLGPKGVDRYAPGRTPPLLPAHNCTTPAPNAAVYVLGCPFSIAEELHLIYGQADSIPAAVPEEVMSLTGDYRQRGLVEGVTGWSRGRDEGASTFEAHRNAAGHVQEDIGQFTLYGYGGDFAVAPGYGHNYSCNRDTAVVLGCDPQDKTDRGGQSGGHNIVLVDQDNRTQRYGNTRTTAPTVKEVVAAGDLAWARADTRYQFGTGLSPLGQRDWLFTHVPGRPVRLVMLDRLAKDAAPHSYNWQMHTSAQNVVSVQGSGFTIAAPSGAVLTGITARNGDAVASTAATFTAQPFLPNAFSRPSAHTLLTQRDPAPAVRYEGLAQLAITRPGEVPAPGQRLDVVGGNAVQSTFQGRRDVTVSRLIGASAVTGSGISTDGDVANLTEERGESLLVDGSHLSAFGREYVRVTGGRGTVAVSAVTASASGTPGAVYRVFAPQELLVVSVNGQPARTERDGDYVSFGAPEPPAVATPVISPGPLREGDATRATADFVKGAAPFTCTVDYGDGGGPVSGLVDGSTCVGPVHIYPADGTFPLAVTVTDGSGLTGRAAGTVTVEDVPPAVGAVRLTSTRRHRPTTAEAEFHDPGTEDGPYTCDVDHGDGTGPVAGVIAGDTCIGPEHTYGRAGRYTVTVRVVDVAGRDGFAAGAFDITNRTVEAEPAQDDG